jgi:hypothetical protein
VLKHQLGGNGAKKIISTLLQTENIEVLPSAQYFATTIKEFVQLQDDHLSFVDVSLLVLSSDFTIETFDKKLQQAITKKRVTV